MSVATLAVALVVAAILFAVVLNHCYARLALVELTLNEGLPPGYESPVQSTTSRSQTTPVMDPAASLEPGVHIFVSRSCHACQRLLDELDQSSMVTSASIHLRSVDRPRPLAASVADQMNATLHEHQAELAAGLAADPLPYAIAMGDHGLLSRSVVPTLAQIVGVARDAGIPIRVEIPTDTER